ncbi:MAG: hypothetical protein PHF17_06220 [Arcobacteraceae bacterium]|nr:hypothetical protein [Arcobacteraceae bacterium]
MEINTYSQNTLYQTVTTSNSSKNTTDKDSSQFTTLLSSHTETSTSNSNIKEITYAPKTDLEKYLDYVPVENRARATETYLIVERQCTIRNKNAELPWEEQLVYPNLQLGFEPQNDLWLEEHKDLDPLGYEWTIAMRSATNGNKYDGAPEFKAFVYKWMATGLTEDEALQRAGSYADAGLLDYGSQRASMYSGMPLTDTKQHGLWLIDNPLLKKAILETLDELSTPDASDLVISIFYGYPENSNSAEQTSFQELLTKYGVKLEDLKQKDPQFAKDNPEVFTGDINLKNDNSTESQAYNNFIFKTLIGFFKDRIESLDRWAPQDPNVNFTSTKESINLLIDNFQEKVDEYNENITNGKSIGKK